MNLVDNIRLIELFSNLNEFESVKDFKNRGDVIRKIENNEYESDPIEFYKSLKQSKHPLMLTDYTVDDLSKMRLFKLKGYNIGFALKGGNEIVAVHNNEKGIKEIGFILMQSAIRNGGIYLNHFDGFLTNLYSKLGFKEYKREKYDPKYDEDGLFASKYGKQDIIYRKYTN